ncbi:MAG TPA: hypothetical protein DHV36_03845, partial [Desulfobacteraceae bacterium]|nr:hypothetical protein [Desulfobacteraceae bacterium]
KDLDQLKAVVLSIDWEITSGSISQFNEICGHLLQKWKDRPIYVNLLKIMKSLVDYIRRKKADAHADAIDFFKSVFTALETMIQNPELTPTERKQLYNEQIQRFNRFKEMAASPSKHMADKDGQTPSGTRQDMPPALSHLGHGATQDDAGASELTLLDPDAAVVEPVSRKQAEEDIQPALQGKTGGSPHASNVMDDLLNPKETEADKMLDTIHLMDVGGTNPAHNPAAMAGADDALKPGMSKITPSVKDSVPIPEIEQTLNEFFHLEAEPEKDVEAKPVTPLDSAEDAVPQDNEKEAAGRSGSDLTPVLPQEPDETDLTRLGKLEDAFSRLPEDLGETVRMDVLNDLDTLKTKWMDDPIKSNLVNLIDILFNRLCAAGLEQDADRTPAAEADDSDARPPGHLEPEPDNSVSPEPPPQKGMLSKLKRFFSS